MTASYKEIRARAKMPEQTVNICYAGDLVAEFQDLEHQLEQLEKAATGAGSLSGDGSAALIERMDAIQAEMAENTYPVKLRGMPGPKWRKFIEAFPPRRGDDGEIREEDRALGLNTEDFWPALIRASIVDPELPTDADWDEFTDGLTDYQYTEMGEAAWALNRRDVNIPFSRVASRMRRTFADE